MQLAKRARLKLLIAAYSCRTASRRFAIKLRLMASLTFNALSLASCAASVVCADMGLRRDWICSF